STSYDRSATALTTVFGMLPAVASVWRTAPALRPTCTERLASVAPAIARACARRPAATCTLLLLRLACSTSWSSTGSENTFHHRPCDWASAATGAAEAAGPLLSLKAVGVAGRLAGSIEALVAQPASTNAITSGASAIRSLRERRFMVNSLVLVVIRGVSGLRQAGPGWPHHRRHGYRQTLQDAAPRHAA